MAAHNILPDDFVSFLRAWRSDPARIGAFAPSGGALADLITSEITAASDLVLELGPGTGVFTRALLARGVREENLTLVEYGSDFARMLQARFPSARVLWMDAGRIGQHALYDEEQIAEGQISAVISGLPLLTMSPRKIMAILNSAFLYLKPGGAYYQFTYGPRCPVSRPLLDRLGLKATCMGHALLNFPPASVYRITRRGPARGRP